MDTIKSVSTKMKQIAFNANRLPDVAFTSLAYHMDLEWLVESHKSVRKNGAKGVDGVSAEDYAADLRNNLMNLLELAKSGKYKAPAVRRTFIPKPGSKEKRALGIPTFEDKILQMAVNKLLTPIYEQDFYDSSYGFRPGRSQHQAIRSLWKKLMDMGGAWVIDLDIRKFFDSIKWTFLEEIVKQRVRDGVIIRLLGKWMNAGIMENGKIEYTDKGVPQGGNLSPLIANIFLHEVFDKWLHEAVYPRLKSDAFEIRFADDAVICFRNKEDAERVLKVLPKRLAKYGLTMHPEKTKLVYFKKPSGKDEDYQQKNRPGSFTFLGFKHFWKKSRKGNPTIGRKTDSAKFTTGLRKIYEWCKKNRHLNILLQANKLNQKLRGHYNYYGINGNYKCLSNFLCNVERIWFKWLNRRSRDKQLNWKKMKRKILANTKLLSPYIPHSRV